MVSKTESSKASFTPDAVFAAVLYNQMYGNTQYRNLPDVVGDAQRMRETLKDVLRIPDKNITFLKDGTWDKVE
jgi:hypothetical protein